MILELPLRYLSRDVEEIEYKETSEHEIFSCLGTKI